MPPNDNNSRKIVRRENPERLHRPKGKNYLLAIGINDYAHCPTLSNAVNDAEKFVELMQKKYQFEEENVWQLLDQAATKDNILDEFYQMAERVTPADNCVIYFSGHGEYNKVFKDGYWIPVNARQNRVGDYIANSTIKTILSAINSHHTFLIADSCFSGSLFAKGTRANVSKRLFEHPSRWGLTSGRNEIVSDGATADGHSPFAKSLLYILENNTQNMGVAALCNEVLEMTVANANQTPLGEPLKVEGHKNGQFVFHLKKDEIRDWLAAKAKHTVAAYASFLVMYPDGKYAAEARKIKSDLEDKADYELAKNEGSIWGYDKYLKDHPQGKYVKKVEESIAAIDELAAWDKAKSLNTYTSYRNYLKNYRKGKHGEEAQQRMASILALQQEPTAWNKAKSDHTIASYTAYLEKYINGEHAAEAKKNLTTLQAAAKRQAEKARKEEEKRQREEAKRRKAAEEAAKKRRAKAEKERKQEQEVMGQSPTPPNANRKKIVYILGGIVVLALAIWGISEITGGTKPLSHTDQQDYDRYYEDAQAEEGAKNFDGTLLSYRSMLRIRKTDSISDKIAILQKEKTLYEAALVDTTQAVAMQYEKIYPEGYFIDAVEDRLKILRTADESEAWQETQSQNTIAAYEGFIQQYPEGEYIEEAKTALAKAEKAGDDAAWKVAEETNDETAYQAYLDEYNKGAYRKQAEQKIKDLKNQAANAEQRKRDDAAWQTAQGNNTIYSYNKYLSDFPSGKYRRTAQRERDKLDQAEKDRKDYNAWTTAKNTNTIDAYDKYLDDYRYGKYRSEAIQKRNTLKPKPPVTTPTTTKEKDPFRNEMAYVAGGTFKMGCDDTRDANCNDDEKPVHTVTVSSFNIGRTEVTQAQWRAVMGSDPPELKFKGCDQCPVEKVSWNDIQEFLKKLNAQSGKSYRLPTEAEWEYAARGGNKSNGYKYSGSNTIDDVAWYDGNSGSKTHPVKTKKGNELGIYDMSGNVWEWCQDTWHSDYTGAPTNGRAWVSSGETRRVLRGGSWSSFAYYCRSAFRFNVNPTYRIYYYGFRLAHS